MKREIVVALAIGIVSILLAVTLCLALNSQIKIFILQVSREGLLIKCDNYSHSIEPEENTTYEKEKEKDTIHTE